MSNILNSTQKRSIDSNWMYVEQVGRNAEFSINCKYNSDTHDFIVIPTLKDISVKGMCESSVFDVCLIRTCQANTLK